MTFNGYRLDGTLQENPPQSPYGVDPYTAPMYQAAPQAQEYSSWQVDPKTGQWYDTSVEQTHPNVQQGQQAMPAYEPVPNQDGANMSVVDNGMPRNVLLGIMGAGLCVVVTLGAMLCSFVTRPTVPTETPTPTATQTLLMPVGGIQVQPFETPIAELTQTAYWSMIATPLPAVGYSVTVPPTAYVVAQQPVMQVTAFSGGGQVPTAILPPTSIPQPYVPPTLIPQPYVQPTQFPIYQQPTLTWPPVYNTPTGPYPTPISIYPIPAPELVAPPKMDTMPGCRTNPYYLGTIDPRVGCVLNPGESIARATVLVNGVDQFPGQNPVFWSDPNTPPQVAGHQIMISTSPIPNVQCVHWNLGTPPGLSDAVQVIVTTNQGRTFPPALVLIHAYDYAINPWPLTHACGLSPSGEHLRFERTDTLSRYLLALSCPLDRPMWEAWLMSNGSYTPQPGVYKVPDAWRTCLRK